MLPKGAIFPMMNLKEWNSSTVENLRDENKKTW